MFTFVFHVFIVDLLQGVVVSFMISFFVCFHVNSSYIKVRFNIVIRSNHIRPYAVDLKFYILYVFFYYKICKS